MGVSMRRAISLFWAAAAFSFPIGASAFCGFYVSGADASLYSSATMVVMMREGTTTVLSMQNNYQGPPEDFAMVVPVPVVLEKSNVKTLPRAIFDRVDSLAAPRLVEYWEQDPCYVPPPIRYKSMAMRGAGGPPSRARSASPEDFGVTIEAQFSVAEYDILILSARDSSGLDRWLRLEKYNIPKGAEKVLQPYVQAGTKFFVAKVDAERVTFDDGRAVLSPLRFHYDTGEFSLPVRLGLLNSAGQQDLLVHILARGQRYEVANYPNATIPTNIVVKDETRRSYGEFYDLLFRRTVAMNPGAVVTEYAWDANSCDPCPVPALTPSELATLGADVLHGRAYGFVLTRLHYRYGPEGLGQDLVFRPAPPIIGGRGMPDREGKMREESAQPSGMNNFQGRYIILHWWEEKLACANPIRGRWGGPPGRPMPVFGAPNPLLRPGGQPPPSRGAAGGAPPSSQPPPPLASIGMLVTADVPAIQVVAGRAEGAHPNDPGPAGIAAGMARPALSGDDSVSADATGGGGNPAGAGGAEVADMQVEPSRGGCASCALIGSQATDLSVGVLIAAFGFVFWLRRRKRRRG